MKWLRRGLAVLGVILTSLLPLTFIKILIAIGTLLILVSIGSSGEFNQGVRRRIRFAQTMWAPLLLVTSVIIGSRILGAIFLVILILLIWIDKWGPLIWRDENKDKYES